MNWQPIETAPKGKSVLLYAGKHCPLYCGKQRFGNLGDPQQDEHAWRCDSSGRFAAPTHWMPLPAAPGAPAVGESFEDRISDWAHGDALDAERYRWLFGARTADELQALTADSGPPLDKPQDVVMCELMTNYVTKAYADAMIDGARADQAAAAKESP